MVGGGLGLVGVGLGDVVGPLRHLEPEPGEERLLGIGVAGCNRAQATVDYKTAHDDATASTVAFVAGGGLLAAGAVLWFTAPSVHVAPAVGFAGRRRRPRRGLLRACRASRVLARRVRRARARRAPRAAPSSASSRRRAGRRGATDGRRPTSTVSDGHRAADAPGPQRGRRHGRGPASVSRSDRRAATARRVLPADSNLIDYAEDAPRDFYAPSSVNTLSHDFQGGVFDGRYVYFAPIGNGTITRYDTQGSFETSGRRGRRSTRRRSARPQGFSGAVYDGRYVYFVPYQRLRGLRGHRGPLRHDDAASLRDAGRVVDLRPRRRSRCPTRGPSSASPAACSTGSGIYFAPNYGLDRARLQRSSATRRHARARRAATPGASRRGDADATSRRR